MVVVIIFLGLVLITLVARLGLWPDDPNPDIEGVFQSGNTSQKTLFVYVHGLERGRDWHSMREVLSPHGSTLRLNYPYAAFSNADPLVVARRLSEEINSYFEADNHERVVLIGQSMGALLVKRIFLDAEEADQPWASRVKRVVLVAGMNRGWDISGQKPSDMSFGTRFRIWFGTWVGRMVGFGKLILSAETGTPFVANLRMDWIKRMADPDRPGIEVVQLLGDIDNMVSAEDNKDLRAVANGRFAWIKVRGSGHPNIVDFKDDTKVGNLKLGDYRRQKFALATTEPDFDVLDRENEVLPFQPDPDVTHVVFVVHGIRDLGEWAAAFEQELQKQFKDLKPPGSDAKLAIASVRYGYFGMGPFLLRPVREKYVKWLMDEYTETLAQYPNADQVHFVGHSNGTYLLTAALERYSSLDLGRIVFGGSVVRKDYPWSDVLKELPPIDGSEKDIRVVNYTAIDDWVVALFPRFFEPKLMAPLRNDIGSAGFNGFTTADPQVENIGGLSGGHAAFLSRIPEIADFILTGKKEGIQAGKQISAQDSQGGMLAMLSDLGSRWATWVIVWPLLAIVIVVVGWHVVTAAAEPRWPIFVAYAVLLLLILRNV